MQREKHREWERQMKEREKATKKNAEDSERLSASPVWNETHLKGSEFSCAVWVTEGVPQVPMARFPFKGSYHTGPYIIIHQAQFSSTLLSDSGWLLQRICIYFFIFLFSLTQPFSTFSLIVRIKHKGSCLKRWLIAISLFFMLNSV